MNSRERVLTALRHQEPDRVPIDLNGMRSTGVAAIAYNKLKQHLGLQTGATRVYDITQQLAMPDEALLEHFKVDVRPLPRLYKGMNLSQPGWQPYTLPDGSPAEVPASLKFERLGSSTVLRDARQNVVYQQPDGALYFDTVYHPLAEASTFADIEAEPLPIISDAELEWLRAEAQRLRSSTDKAIMGHSGVNLYETAQRLRGWSQFMLDLGANPELAQYLMGRLAENAIENLNRWLGAVGEYIDIIQMGDDLGTQSAPQISPAMYRRLIKPYHRQVWQHAKQLSGKPVFLHSCGSIYPLLPDLIDAGLDILNPVQISAAGMDPARLKREFGRDLVFWGGGADTQSILPHASPEQVRQHVRELLEIFMPGGGYVFCAVHNIQADVPPENIAALYAAAEEFGGYPA